MIALAEAAAPAELLQEIARRVRRIELLVNGGAHLLELLRGCEIDRDEMLELCSLVADDCEALTPLLRDAIRAVDPAASGGAR